MSRDQFSGIDLQSLLVDGSRGAVEIDLSSPIPGSGWYDAEKAEGRTYRWTGPAPEFDLEVLPADADIVCSIAMIPGKEGSFDHFAIWHNGAAVSYRTDKEDGKLTISFAIPAHEAGRARRSARYTFRHRSVFRPADAGGTDRRSLGLAICSIRFARKEGAASSAGLPAKAGAAADRGNEREALVIDDSVPEPDKDAGSNAVLQHILALQRLGYRVSFVPADNMARIDPYTAALEGLGVECFHRPDFTSVADVLRRRRNRFDLAYLHRHSNASRYATAVRQHSPSAHILYNVADLHFLRLERQGEIEGNPSLCEEADTARAAELAAMRLADCVVVHSSAEADLLRRLAPELRVRVVPWTIEPRPVRQRPAPRPGLAFIAGYRHPPNLDAAKWAVNSIMPRLRSQRFGIELLLVGSHMPPDIAALAAPDVVPLGQVPSLDEIFGRVRLTIAPLRYGAGLKGKVLDSLAAGVPCVMTAIAAEGLNLPSDLQSLVADEPHAIARRIIRLLRDAGEYRAISEAAQSYIRQNYAPDRIDALLRAACTPQ